MDARVKPGHDEPVARPKSRRSFHPAEVCSLPLKGGGGQPISSSDAENAPVGEQCRRAARVQEDDILGLAPTPLSDQGDQARERLAGINGIERKRLKPARKPDRFDGGFVRDPVGWSRMKPPSRRSGSQAGSRRFRSIPFIPARRSRA